ncbi:auxin-responsive protein SAUR40 [Zea mays]|jgi:SAUR family protein|uniref:Auxin responsive protein n=1 Tax=Zea mays TaxID=4577 RepID=A0A1D6KZ40_MAIZE|nr:auxin-responsive protein SAUR40 [Zea mays]ONM07641.1 Auxin responsive protein [Zea mays]|eukprot:XP_008666775.1 auxin-responsive protein SAUR40 [Zea mays]
MVSWKKKRGGGGESQSPIRGAAEQEKVPRGHVPMLAAGEDDDAVDVGERVLGPVTLLSDPSVAELLDMAAQRYGYGQPGVLRVPCDAGRFRQVLHGAMHRRGIISSSA